MEPGGGGNEDAFFVPFNPASTPVPPPPRVTPPSRPPGPSWTVVAAAGLAVLVVIGALVVRAGSSGPTTALPDPGASPVVDVSPLPLSGPGYAVWVANDDGTPVRWNPCADIPWVANLTGAPGWALGDLQESFLRVASATGLTFVYEGETDERPSRTRAPYQPERYGDRWAPVLVSWSTPDESTDSPLRPDDRGVAIPIAIPYNEGQSVFVSGQFVMNATRQLEPGFHDRGTTWGGTFLHEMGHLVGLDHVDDTLQLMYTHPGTGPVFYGPGDMAGLRVVGARGGCVPVPTAQTVEITISDQRR